MVGGGAFFLGFAAVTLGAGVEINRTRLVRKHYWPTSKESLLWRLVVDIGLRFLSWV